MENKKWKTFGLHLFIMYLCRENLEFKNLKFKI